jgi:hypothetical protein
MAGAESSQSSEESSDSAESLSEQAPLLVPTANPALVAYRSTATSTTTDLLSQQENGVSEAGITPEEEPKPKNVFGIISLLLIGVFVSNADTTLVITTYAGISSEFGAFENAVWLSTSYTLALCSIQGIVGKVSDIYGRKPVLIVSYLMFALGCVITWVYQFTHIDRVILILHRGLSQSMWQAVMGRVVCGLGGAGMVVIVAVVITGEFKVPGNPRLI